MSILQQKSIEGIVAGQLRSTIDAHGPIDAKWIGSATKRVVRSILGEMKIHLPVGDEHDCCHARIKDLEKQLADAKEKNKSLVVQVDHWREISQKTGGLC